MKSKGIALTLLMLVASVSVLVFSTLALFTDEVETDNRIQAGTLSVDLYETNMEGNRLNAEGKFEALGAFGSEINLRGYAGKVFDMQSACPGMWREGTFRLENNESSTAFTYALKVECAAGTGATQALYGQVEITVTRADGTEETFMLSAAAVSGGKTVDLGEMLKTETEETFKVKAEFLNNNDNNQAQSGDVSFDIKLIATQVTPA